MYLIKSFAKPFRTAALAATLLASGAAGTLALPAPQAHAATTTLAQGADGTDVAALQANLKSLGMFTYPTATGYYGPITAQAVQKFQSAYGLAATGTADATTRVAIARAALKKKLVADTYSYIGTPYIWGGTTPAGFDCSGFVYFMFTKFGVNATRTTSAELYHEGFAVSRDYLQPGDLVFFSAYEDGTITHVGFYVGGGNFISATRSAGIFVQSLSNSYWAPRYMGARRVY
jgi:peptidoglycan endopeptidase LytF